jgi:RecA/RadA recombinase
MSLISEAKANEKALSRVSTGVFSLDLSLGGGLPRGRISMLVGKESSGKSLISTLCSKSISKIDWETGKFGGFTKTLWIDMENDFDDEWFGKLGWDSRNDVVCPDSGEHACDIIREAIESNEYGLIVANSLDCFYPTKLNERSADEGGLPGARAKLLNENFVKWTGQMRRLSRTLPPHKMPTLLCINQYRLTIGAGMFQDPRVIPGGEGQRYYSSIIVSLKSSKIEDAGSAESALVNISGSTIKNKTHPPKKNFEFQVAIADTEDMKVGEVANFKSIMSVLKSRQIQKVKSKWVFLNEEYATQKDITDRIKSDPAFFNVCWDLALSEVLNSGKEELEVGTVEQQSE